MGLMGDAAVGAAIGLVNNQIANLQQLGQQDALSAQQMNYSKQLTKLFFM